MPPSVARPQLPNGHAHATKEPLGKLGVSVFSDGCCTNNTQPRSNFRSNPLFYRRFLERPNLVVRSRREAAQTSCPRRAHHERENRRAPVRIHHETTGARGAISNHCVAAIRETAWTQHSYIETSSRPIPRVLCGFHGAGGIVRSPLFSVTK